MWMLCGKHTKGHTEKRGIIHRQKNYQAYPQDRKEVIEVLRPSDTLLDEIIAEVKSWDD